MSYEQNLNEQPEGRKSLVGDPHLESALAEERQPFGEASHPSENQDALLWPPESPPSLGPTEQVLHQAIDRLGYASRLIRDSLEELGAEFQRRTGHQTKT